MGFLKKKIYLGLASTAAGVILTTAAALSLQMNSFQTSLIPLEGGGAGFQAVNPNTNALGAFQLTPTALQDIGWQDSSGNWTPKAQAAGVSSTSDFLSNPQAQVAADNVYNQNNMNYLGSTYSQRLGTTDLGSGAPLTQGNMAYCSEALGAGGCQQYLATGQVPSQDLAGNPQWANGGFQQNMSAMGNTSLGDTSNVNVNTISYTNADGTTTSTTTVNGVFCDPAVLQAAKQASTNLADNWTALAEMPGTGYTMLGGQSVLQSAGLIQPGQPGYVGSNSVFSSLLPSNGSGVLGGANFAMASCLNSLMGSGLNLIFSPMGLDQILAMIASAACAMAYQLFDQVTMPLNQSLYSTFNMNSMFPPMINPGAITSGFGMNIAPGAGMGSNGILNLQAGQYGSYGLNPNTGWYQQGGGTNPLSSVSSYGSLFGINNLFGTGNSGTTNTGTSPATSAPSTGTSGGTSSTPGSGFMFPGQLF